MTITIADERFMRLAVAAATAGIEQGQTPFGACIVKGDAVVGCRRATWSGRPPTSPRTPRRTRSARRAGSSGPLISPAARFTPPANRANMCFSACHWARITRIVYGAGDRGRESRGV